MDDSITERNHLASRSMANTGTGAPAGPPTKAELAGIIQGRVDEEILAREAIRLGLDKDDMIVRRRLAQKMAFAGEDLAAAEPTDAQLRAYYAANAARYATPARLAPRKPAR